MKTTHLLTTALISTIFATNAYAADLNGNQVNLIQELSNQTAGLDQNGSRNTIETYQGSGISNEVYVTQTGDDNTTWTHQNGNDNYISSDVVGDHNKVNIYQGNKATGEVSNGAIASANITGDFNRIDVNQHPANTARPHESYNSVAGNGNKVFVDQTSSHRGSYSDNRITGHDNTANVVQLGQNESAITIDGSSNGVNVNQINSTVESTWITKSNVVVDGDHNSVHVNQGGRMQTAGVNIKGNSNVASIRQYDAQKSSAFIDQIGNSNSAIINQTAPTNFSGDNTLGAIRQVGNNNTSYLEQSSRSAEFSKDPLVANINVTGNNNNANIIQSYFQDQASILVNGNGDNAGIDQDTVYSIAGIDITGDTNHAFIRQRGDAHTADIRIVGADNNATILQNSQCYNDAWIDMIGNENVSSITQTFTMNSMAKSVQQGNNNQNFMVQEGSHNFGSVMQVGNNNSNNLVQKGTNITARIIQSN